ncbi:hypothetical protein EDB81DRAFT_758561 [Dactylonectria macrodidyma]|uniref:AA1-like domain-containing protein n=1 Tax=Dactylonectria macrodidyma TaxID=307937 RepID=A0A9P9F6L7_9HYPO|nr:hypothetical protein EDB81DRAFT_758561 [Dactylonectria macrodidyma]
MRAFTAITALFAAVVAAAPAPTKEDVWVGNFVVRKTSGTSGTSIQVVSFDIPDFHCQASKPSFPSKATQCDGGSTYFFSLVPSTEDNAEFGLEITRHFKDGSILFGSGAVPTTCRKGGNGANDYVCTQSTPVGIFIFPQ